MRDILCRRAPAGDEAIQAAPADRVDAQAVFFADISPGAPRYLPHCNCLNLDSSDSGITLIGFEGFQCLSAFLPRCNKRYSGHLTEKASFNAYRHSFLVTARALKGPRILAQGRDPGDGGGKNAGAL